MNAGTLRRRSLRHYWRTNLAVVLGVSIAVAVLSGALMVGVSVRASLRDLVLARPETGRLHQIRRHLRHINHPLVGDVAYGSGEINRHYRATYALHRLALHAYRLAFTHPVTGARVAVEAPVPDDLGSALDQLGLPRVA